MLSGRRVSRSAGAGGRLHERRLGYRRLGRPEGGAADMGGGSGPVTGPLEPDTAERPDGHL